MTNRYVNAIAEFAAGAPEIISGLAAELVPSCV